MAFKGAKNLDIELKKLNPKQVLIKLDLTEAKANEIYAHYTENGNGKYEVKIRPDEDDDNKYAVSFKLNTNRANKNA